MASHFSWVSFLYSSSIFKALINLILDGFDTSSIGLAPVFYEVINKNLKTKLI